MVRWGTGATELPPGPLCSMSKDKGPKQGLAVPFEAHFTHCHRLCSSSYPAPFQKYPHTP